MANQYVRRAEKAVKKTHPATLLIALLFLIIGLIGGGFAAYMLSKDDSFALKGEKTVTLAVGETYKEEGFTAVSFGKDISDKVVIDDSAVDLTAPGEYYIVYRVEGDLKYDGCRLVRYVTVAEVENG